MADGLNGSVCIITPNFATVSHQTVVEIWCFFRLDSASSRLVIYRYSAITTKGMKIASGRSPIYRVFTNDRSPVYP